MTKWCIAHPSHSTVLAVNNGLIAAFLWKQVTQEGGGACLYVLEEVGERDLDLGIRAAADWRIDHRGVAYPMTDKAAERQRVPTRTELDEMRASLMADCVVSRTWRDPVRKRLRNHAQRSLRYDIVHRVSQDLMLWRNNGLVMAYLWSERIRAPDELNLWFAEEVTETHLPEEVRRAAQWWANNPKIGYPQRRDTLAQRSLPSKEELLETFVPSLMSGWITRPQ